jgi:hypothetical protein
MRVCLTGYGDEAREHGTRAARTLGWLEAGEVA